MSWIELGFFTSASLILVLSLLSIIESSISRLSEVSLRVLAETEGKEKLDLLENIAADRSHYLLPLQYGNQLLQILIAVLVTTLCWSFGLKFAAAWALLIMVVVISLFRQLIPKMLTQANPEEVLLKLLPFFTALYRVLHWLSTPLMAVLRFFHASRIKKQPEASEGEEATHEEIQAYIDVGEEEGIIEEEESELIQSALEFGNTLVKEIMTPRMDIVAIQEDATVSELKDRMVSTKHSRIPVYRKQLDDIVGVVYIRNLLAYLEDGNGNAPITPLINPALFVPDTKWVAKLLKEMQKIAEHLAIVINEYGAVSGLVTLEDLIEEIVGEIRDEDEAQRRDLVREADGNYVVGGGVRIWEVEEELHLDFGDPEATTMSGLVVGHLGRVPASGETLVFKGLEIEILNSDRRKIRSMRVKKLEDRGSKVEDRGAPVK